MSGASKVDWQLASQVARRFSGEYPLAGTYHERKFELQAPDLVSRASEMVAAETGLELTGSPVVGVISRDGWIDTNVKSFGTMLEPLEEKLADSAGIGSSIAAKVMGAELGAVLGFMSKRVLGQYELVLPTGDDDKGDTVLFVGANIMSMERQFEFRPSSFRFWVALHECAHRAQFTGVPWMRGYFLSLVEQLVEKSKPERGRLLRVASELRTAAETGTDALGDAGLIGLFASPEQRDVLDQVQALMSLLEGHGHVVMDRIGEREITDVTRMSNVLKARRKDPKTAAFMKLLGIEMKMKQYENGAAFIRQVEGETSWEALSMAWESPESLPTLAEIDDASLWLDRMAG
ncbi:MAG: zinc-dependent metalloprotease [Acidimicrobiia bacterium]|nr:MAG: zinc-dependent metalloprotease [Acidimicrobiia bacterium]